MPQDIERVREWQEMLGDGWNEIHRTWLHRLGNFNPNRVQFQLQEQAIRGEENRRRWV